MHPLIFSIGPLDSLSDWWHDPFELHWYAVLIAVGYILGMYLAGRQARRLGKNADVIMDLTFYLLLAGLVGARLLFILVSWRDYLADPLLLFRFWTGGLVFYGGFLGALVFLFWYCQRYKLSLRSTADILIPSVALAHAFGRLGCFMAGCCFGSPTEQPWGIVFPLGSMAHSSQISNELIHAHEHSLPVHPTQLYEASGELGIYFFLLWLRSRQRFNGQIFLSFLIAYPVLRSIIELFRGDAIRGFVIPDILSTSQFISLLLAIAALLFYFKLLRKTQVSIPLTKTQDQQILASAGPQFSGEKHDGGTGDE